MFTWEIMSLMFKNPSHILIKDLVVVLKEIMSWLFKDPINSGLALQNFKKILRADPELWGCAQVGPKWPICPAQNSFVTNHYYYFHLPIASFHCGKFKKIVAADPELWGYAILGPKMVPNIIFIYLLSPFIAQNFKKILTVDPVMMHHFCSNESFFRKPVNHICFFHSYLSACQKLKSDINLLMNIYD